MAGGAKPTIGFFGLGLMGSKMVPERVNFIADIFKKA